MGLSDGLGSSLYEPSNVPTAPPQGASPQEEDQGTNWIDAKDIYQAPLRGVARFGESLLNLGKDSINLVRGLWGKATGDELEEDEKLKDFDFDPFLDATIGTQDSVLGGMATGIVQFAAGMFTATKALSGIQWIAKGGAASAITRGAVADIISFDEHEERLSNMVEDFFPALHNPITEFLAADDDDHWAIGRLKNAVEGIGLGFLQDSLVGILKNYKGFQKLNKLLTQTPLDEAVSKEAREKAAKLLVDQKEAFEDFVKRIGEADEVKAAQALKTLGIDSDAATALTDTAVKRYQQDKGVFDTASKLLDSRSPEEIRTWFDELEAKVAEGADINTLVYESDHILGLNAKHITSPEDAALLQRTLEDVIVRGRTPRPLTTSRALDMLADTPGWALSEAQLADISADRLAPTVVAQAIVLSNVHKQFSTITASIQDTLKQGFKVSETDFELWYNTAALLQNYGATHVKLKQAIGTALDAAQIDVRNVTTKLDELYKKTSEGYSRRQAGKMKKSWKRFLAQGTKRDARLATQEPDKIATVLKRHFEGIDPTDQKAAMARFAACAHPHQAAKMLAGYSRSQKFLRAHNQWWTGCILSGPRTVSVNTISTAISTILKPMELAVGSAMGGDWKGTRAALSQYWGMAETFRGAVKLEGAARAGIEEGSTGARSVMEATKDSFLKSAPQLDGNPKFDNTTEALSAEALDINPASAMGKIVNAFGAVSKVPFRFLSATDEMFKQLSYRGKLSADIADDLFKQGLDKNSDEFAEQFARRFEDAFDPATGQGVNKPALQFAEEATFTNTPTGPIEGFVYQNLKAWSSNPWFKPFIPFVRTPMNIVNYAWDRTPVMRKLRHEVRADLLSGDPKRIAKRRGELAMGSMFWATAAILANEGKITGSGPQNPEARALWRQAGNQPYSVKIGDKFVSFSRLDPFGTIFGFAADFAQMSGHITEEQSGEVASMMIAALSHNLTSKTYLRGITEAFEAFFDGGESKLDYWLKGRAASYVPKFISAFNDDPHLREVRTYMDAIKNQIPGLSSTLPPRRNIFGEPITLPHGLGWDFASPFAMTQKVDDKVKNELARLGHGFSMPSKIYGKFDLTQARTVEGREAYDRLLELTGQVKIEGKTLDKALAYLMKQRAYKDSPEEAKNEFGDSGIRVKSIQRLMSMYKAQAMKQLQRECPEFAQYRAQRRAEQLGKITARRRSSGLMALLN